MTISKKAGKEKPEAIKQADFRIQARILKALAHESRLTIVQRLASGPCSVKELVSLIGRDQSTVSKHLAVLKAAELVDSERKYRTVEYSLVTPCVMGFLDCAAKVIHARKA
jgi:ArsR family transcriptional regulator